MKRKTAKEILALSFRELAQQKPIDKITIKEIVDNCGYSTATFYRQFKDKYDLIAWDYSCEHKQIIGDMQGSFEEWQKMLVKAAKHFYEQKEYLANLLLHTSGYDSFFKNMINIHFNNLSGCILNCSKLEQLDEETQMYIRLYSHGATELTCDWILGKFNATPEKLAEVYKNSLPSPLQKYLFVE